MSKENKTSDFIKVYGYPTYEILNKFLNESAITNICKKIGPLNIALLFDSIYVEYEYAYTHHGIVIMQFGKYITFPNTPEYEAYQRDSKLNSLLH